MNKIVFIFFLIVTCFANSQNATDCVDAIAVCGNSNVNLDVNGFGIQEIAGLGCSSQENNSLWLRVKPLSDGTLGFNLIPTNISITEDYDFWVFGPNVTCGNLGLPIRCSTTNPQAAGQGNNHTGMNSTSTDTSEGPGPNGDSFVRWLDVLQDEVYFIVIDRPVGNSGFNLEWTGTADLGTQPESQINQDLLNYDSCDTEVPFDDGIMSINLEDNTPLIQGSQTDVVITYHSTETDAILGIAPLLSPYSNSESNETIYVRITNSLTDCFDISSFEINILPSPIANNISHVQCDEDGIYDGFTPFNLNNLVDDITSGSPTSDIEYFLSAQDALANINSIEPTSFTNTSNPQTIYTRVSNSINNCVNYSEVFFQVSTAPLQDYQVPAVCDEIDSEDGFNTFSLDDITAVLSSGLPPNVSIVYYETLDDALNELNPLATPFTNTIPYSQTIIARANDPLGCYGIGDVTFSVKPLPQLEEDELLYYCLNYYPETITLESGIQDSNHNNYTYLWSTGEISESIEINEPGNYSVTVTRNDCSSSRTITVETSNIANIEDITVIDASLTYNNTVTVQASGEGTYQYALFNHLGAYRYYQESNVFDNVVPGFYTVKVRDVKNMCGIVEQLISVIGFPKFFTPNNDGYSDTWQVYGIAEQFQPQSRILIFDRFGKLIKELDPLGKGWDGTFNGQPLPNTDYWFQVTLQDGRVFKSHFTLKR